MYLCTFKKKIGSFFTTYVLNCSVNSLRFMAFNTIVQNFYLVKYSAVCYMTEFGYREFELYGHSSLGKYLVKCCFGTQLIRYIWKLSQVISKINIQQIYRSNNKTNFLITLFNVFKEISSSGNTDFKGRIEPQWNYSQLDMNS